MIYIEALRLTLGNIDDIIFALGPEFDSKVVPAEFLLSAWRRATGLQRGLRDAKHDPRKSEILATVKQMCIRYLGHCFTMPDMFDQCPGSGSLAKYLIIDPENNHGLSYELLTDIAASITASEEEGDCSLRDVFGQALEEMRKQLSKMDISDDYKPYLDVRLQR